MANGRTPNSDSQEIFSWLIIIGALIVVWPIGLVLLFRKLTKSNRAKSNPRPDTTSAPPPMAAIARTTARLALALTE